jgi:hypothetical protein
MFYHLDLNLTTQAESRGPFDFGLSSSRKFANGDSVSFGAVVKDLQEMEPLEKKIKLQKH